MVNPSEILLFSEAAHTFALPLAEVKEIINLRRIIPVPFANPFVIGLTSVRGLMIPVVSPYVLLRGRGQRRYLSDVEYAAFVEVDGMQVALACKKIVGVKSISGNGKSSSRKVTRKKSAAKPSIPEDNPLFEELTVETEKVFLLKTAPLVLRSSDTMVDERFSEVR